MAFPHWAVAIDNDVINLCIITGTVEANPILANDLLATAVNISMTGEGETVSPSDG